MSSDEIFIWLIRHSVNGPKLSSSVNIILNKKVLLCERKRHTACHVASTPYVVLPGYPPPGRVPPGQGTPQAGYPPGQGTPLAGYPPAGSPRAGYPPTRVPSWLDLAGYLPQLPHGILGNVAKHYGIWVPPRCEQTENITFPILRMRAVITHLWVIYLVLRKE